MTDADEPTRIVLLRGINVGGHRKVAMAELRDGLSLAGFGDVRTYIQSGNAVVTGGPVDEADAVAAVRGVLVQRFGLDDVPIVIRSSADLHHARAVSAERFVPDPDDADHAKLVHVVFLSEPPAPTRRASLDPDAFGNDRFHLDVHDGRAELHVHYVDGAATSKLTVDRIERAYGVRGTGRNLNTVDRLIAMTAN